VQTALERIIRKTAEMVVVEKKVSDGEADMAPLLIDALNISVAANSETTVTRYRELLPTLIENDEVEEVELSPLENALKVALIDHAVMIKRCLTLLGKLPKASLAGSSLTVEELSQSTFPIPPNFENQS
jgi:hypothetical protein